MKCATEGCDKQQTGKSKYCPECKKVAKGKWIAMVKEKGQERDQKKTDIAAAFKAAHEAGLAAGNANSPVPMVVQQHANMMDDSSPVTQQWVVNDGVCGFAWVRLNPARGTIADMFKELGARPAYGGGLQLHCFDFNQSMSRKEAYCKAYAQVMRDRGYTGFSWSSRMD
jgi:hypothetical protein